MMLQNSVMNVPVGSQQSALPTESVIFGSSAAMQSVRSHLEKIKARNVPVLMQGESGTGKEVVSQFLHERSPWRQGPFLKVNCPAIPSTLLESELFGFEKGSFTGANNSKPGMVERADRGTLFLDEIGELDTGIQAKLLQLLQDGQFTRIGGQRVMRVQVRFVCATNHHLEKEILTGGFREDLFYRINVVTIQLPPLRQRREDIPGLVDYFIDTQSEMFKCETKRISPAVMRILKAHDWPGNIRQLENVIKRYVVLGTEDSIHESLIEGYTDPLDQELANGGRVALKRITRQAVRDVERRIILKALQAHHWNRKNAAHALSISYRSLLYKIRESGLPLHNGHGPNGRESGSLD